MRLIPYKTPGKPSLCRWILKAFERDTPGTVRDTWGNSYRVPNFIDAISISLLAEGVYEREVISAICRCASRQSSPVIIDVGANVGAVAIPLSGLLGARHVRIFAFEASPKVRSYLEENIAHNQAHSIKVVPFAAWNESTRRVSFLEVPSTFGASSVVASSPFETVLVDTLAIDDFVQSESLSSVAVLKVDVEGAELRVLEGAKALLGSPSPPFVIFEYNAALDGPQGAAAAFAFLSGLGFTLYELEDFLKDRPPLARAPEQGFFNLVAAK